jgi:CRP-like cAMP-binding protein/Fe-S-cluster-containing hydrogenase component 2
VEKFPGSILLRNYQQGEVICRQGEAGNSAFYIAKARDLETLFGRQLKTAQTPDQPVATAHILSGSSKRARPRSWWQRLLRSSKAGAEVSPDTPIFIPNDGPTDIDYQTRQASIFEGDVFGEMSCMTHAPRSATVVAAQNCYLVEFNRNIFDQMQKDVGYRQQVDKIYRERVLDSHLKQLEYFRDLDPAQLEELTAGATLHVFDPGDVICDQHDPSDCVYIVRSGVVQVVTGVATYLSETLVQDWPGFCKALIPAGEETVLKPASESPLKPVADSAVDDILAAARGGKAEEKPAAASVDDILAAARGGKAEEKPADESVDDILAAARGGKAEEKPAAESVDDILAAARGGKAEEKPADESVDDILAAARGGKAEEKPAAESVDDILAAARGGKAEEKPAAASVDDILAAARGGKAEEKPADESVDDILAAARGGKAEEKPAADSVDDILAAARGGKAEEKLAAESVDDILAAARGGKAEEKPAAASVDDILAAARGGDESDSPPIINDDEDQPARLVSTPTKPVGSAEATVWHWCTSSVQAAIRRLAQETSEDDDRPLVISALNQLVRQRELAASKDLLPVFQRSEVAQHVNAFPKGIKGASKDWSELEVRIGNFSALRSMFPDHLPSRHGSSGPPRILGYLARGECFGEMGVIADQPRSASCLAYDHPHDDPSRRPGRVEIVRIDAEVFRSLMDGSEQLSRAIGDLVKERKSELETRPSIGESSPWDSTPEFRDGGLIQGQNLLLIDLDSCTRCGDCVRACINTHDDGYSRLFLDGPRFDRFLVPSACRLCLNPSCMIGCPVGSIQRGDNGQIEIRDWCIGCSLCARQCPYDSIQMHDVGLLPEHALGWMFTPLSSVGSERWQDISSSSATWMAGQSPFRWNLDFQHDLSRQSPDTWSAGSGQIEEPILFRYEMKIDQLQLSELGFIRLQVISEGLAVTAWINGTSIELTQDAKQAKKGEFVAEFSARDTLRTGRNSVAIQLEPAVKGDGTVRPADGSTLLNVRLDAVPDVGVITAATADGVAHPSVELVTQRAVTCDICSGLDGQGPACVSQCPHDAAMRVDARSYFPVHR